MRTAKRRVDPGVAQQLLAEPQRFQFFQALRILERLFVRQGHRVEDVVPRKVRFMNSMSLGFAPSEIESAQAFASDGMALDRSAAIEHAVTMEDLGEVHITPAFMGLLGAGGVLPLHYTERLSERETYHRDRAARAFLDVFTNRAVALHYAAWKKHRLALQYELDNNERFLPLVLSLSGVGMQSLRRRMVDGEGDVFDQAIAHYAGAIRQHPVSAVLLQRILSDYFNVSVRIEQFVGAWYAVPGAQRTRLGVGNAQLGSTALAGERVWQRDLRMRLWIGPLDRGHFHDFLPGGSAAKALAKWLTLLTGACLEYEVRLTLKAEHVTGIRMGAGGGARLGWDSYVCSRPSETPRSDTRYGIHTLQ
ncbi:type VI secretion system baseplate subunit TssG [Montanilutibacter psychrotolerans]|uniref:Type VI secretion system baseplate subunit TssG n=1 Tax=Montanilutibacter psychrotolerans TaxID=1327343 RepID=A0A3M8SNL7_9GAMM|nr:type VI secretion system baseplate subunit TssG [Lysobacter psychrotolerans]RNF82393.1 type VI secretion system baseplate subunit TssG [Lysobacter psychrotolerans]